MKRNRKLSNTAIVMSNILWSLCIWPDPLYAQSAEARKAMQGLSPDPLSALHLSNYLIGIVIVFLALAAASLLLRRYQSGVGRGPIRIQSCLSLGGKERIMVIEVQGQQYLIGVSAAGINLLRVLEQGAQHSVEQKKSISKQSSPAEPETWLGQTLKSAIDS